ncbi:MAG: sugar-binding transcriptional regulator [Pseudomonadota bacterium]|uniref:Transcriptional regulator n=1 Tax=Caballeronia sordidicola TaxID=196367 RepID=A0A242MHT0_CABSO|nr:MULTISPECIES: sugar-binding transcriptional regulator [Burkholderiaceae]AMH43071.1 DNA-binding transcriptional regulator [Burkholderia sp. PAMC 26561]MDP9157421.1 sugar-binding transcriptional regulator [Pseudomonadota bacterium]OTP67965.1 Transcriptional regulator [Caballeronia sordidicola]OTP70737.1 Transcriptional regulator [Caballeronia sordidicola]
MNKPAPPAVAVSAEPFVDTEEELQARVAWHYYVGNLTQQEIAQRIGSNRVRVNRLLAASRESGMVQITINSRLAPCVALEEALTKRFGLEAAVVVPTGANNEANMAAIGIGGATYLARQIEAGQTIGLGWGRTIRAVLRALPQRAYGPVSAVSLQGGLSHCPSINTFDIVSDFANLCQADGFLFAAPIYVSSQNVRDMLLQEGAVRETYERARQSDLALLTCGDLTESLVVTYGINDPEQVRTLEKAGAVGDMLGHFMDADGEAIDHPLNRRTVAITLGDLRKIKRVVLVSGGAKKFAVTRAALRGRYPSVLVTDEETARRLCDEP